MNFSATMEDEVTRPQQRQTTIPRPTRYQVRLPLHLTHNVFVGTQRTESVCTDINEYGMGVDIAQPLLVGEIVKLELELPNDCFEAYARVIYRKNGHCGLYFVDLSPEQQQKLAQITCEWQTCTKQLVQ